MMELMYLIDFKWFYLETRSNHLNTRKYNIYIYGEKKNANTKGDGIDSNGNIYIFMEEI